MSGNFVDGGAIYNYRGTIEDITGDFIGNYASGSSSSHGGAIYLNGYADTGVIGNITGDFIGNYASSSGGAIYSDRGTIANITGDFIAIYSDRGTIANITGDFIGNYASSSRSSAVGGAIFNDYNAKIGDVTGDFIGNYASSTNVDAFGGAIHNQDGAEIRDIKGNFIGNYVYSSSSYYGANGGAISNYDGTIGNLTGDFIGNYAVSTEYGATGGAIYNYSRSTIGDITGNFIGNYASSTDSYARGGAIYNYDAEIGDIKGDFIGNYATSGGAIYNWDGTIGNITGDFIGNNASSSCGAIYNDEGTIGDITGDFIGNYASSTDSFAQGGAIYNDDGTIGDITGDFIGNYASGNTSALGGAIYNTSTVTIYTGSGGGGAAPGSLNDYVNSFDSGEIVLNNNVFSGNYAQGASAYGGAIFSDIDYQIESGGSGGGEPEALSYLSEISTRERDVNIPDTDVPDIAEQMPVIELVNTKFFNNYAKSTSQNGEALGGAIYANQHLNITAKDGGQSIFSGNYTESNGVKTPNAIYVVTSPNPDSINTEANIISIDNNKITYQEITKIEETQKHPL